ncbi:unnamed protein product [Rotaria socialis]|uniref:Uncharacterized protein n=1 Tax=Rotaria socialis TaxID=392032 RepID=A0A820DRN4_9BILA|nr:unnamed protein product [Rotaria socialis]CAF4647963.1 unnamed protein product [Rotaria socialis]
MFLVLRPSYKKKFLRHVLCRRWILSLRKPESIAQHVTLFEQNLCELVEQLKEFVYLDIYWYTDPEKVEPYRSMVQKRFPNSQLHIEISRFRLWF